MQTQASAGAVLREAAVAIGRKCARTHVSHVFGSAGRHAKTPHLGLGNKRLRRVGRKKARQNSAGHGRSALRRFYAHRKNTTDGRYSRAGDNPQ